MSDTIFALATAPGRAAVAVVRLSGPAAGAVVERLARGPMRPRRATLRTLRRPGDGEVLDQALVLWLPGPGSVTGEDCAELQLHGGGAVVDSVTAVLLAEGLRLAAPGEFTRRAFENGKLDLAQAEAVADLVDAETEGQRRQALAQLDGALSRLHAGWRGALVECLAVLEAAVDFPDEDLPEEVAAEAAPMLAKVSREIHLALDDGARGERIREGFRVALVGAPNAGKSSLLNGLVGRDAAIVTPLAGTTRDVIEVPLTLAGYRVVLADTAGVRAAADVIEAEGVRRARAWAEAADLRLFVVDAAADDGAWEAVAPLVQAGDLCLLNKSDLAGGVSGREAKAWAADAGVETRSLSVSDAASLAALRIDLEAKVAAVLSGAEFPAATQARHRRDLEAAAGCLDRALLALDQGAGVELATEDVRLAARSLARISGGVDAEDVLDRVFARFCIGK
ncbi:MAG: tRNA uridine-5-carboxymethylaminomethyl(34) synthesis GTPase MnmE [Caulobacteraceae bacterium]|nr:tRNA uridine-5-carboxymethylaminomethyl(34) synthesis GTPase MnmE [Caulobacteraceae bacterium]